MVERESCYPSSEPDVGSPLAGSSDERLWRGDVLPAGAMVFSEPGLIITKRVKVLDQLQVALQG
jgi:hypothetical protein